VLALDCPLVEITGGEPLLQRNVHPLMTALCDAGQTVLIETSGAHDISVIDSRVHRIMDLKTPGSGECARNLWSNIPYLAKRDEVKFVIGSREGLRMVPRATPHARPCHTLWLRPLLADFPTASSPREIVEWLVADKLPRPLPASDAQVHLGSEAERGVRSEMFWRRGVSSLTQSIMTDEVRKLMNAEPFRPVLRQDLR
jgi:hypothetical protein